MQLQAVQSVASRILYLCVVSVVFGGIVCVHRGMEGCRDGAAGLAKPGPAAQPAAGVGQHGADWPGPEPQEPCGHANLLATPGCLAGIPYIPLEHGVLFIWTDCHAETHGGSAWTNTASAAYVLHVQRKLRLRQLLGRYSIHAQGTGFLIFFSLFLRTCSP